MHEHIVDFSEEENQQFSEIICYGLDQEDIEYLEAMAEVIFIEEDITYKGARLAEDTDCEHEWQNGICPKCGAGW